jgi:hypothetical protein
MQQKGNGKLSAGDLCLLQVQEVALASFTAAILYFNSHA